MNLRELFGKRVSMAAGGAVAAQVAIQDVADEFYEDFATEAAGRYWWWIRMVLLEPNELIVDDGRDELYRVPFAIGAGADEDADGDPNITFGDPVPIKVVYQDVAAKTEQVAAACTGIASVRGEKVAARFGSREESRLNATEGGVMHEYIEKMRSKLGLSASAKDEEVLAAAAAHLEAEPGTGDGGTGTGTDGGQEGQEGAGSGDGSGDGAGENGQPAPAEQQAAGTVAVDAQALQELRDAAAQGVEARQEQLRIADQALLAAAVEAGKFPPSRREHYAKLLKADREGTIELIEELDENVVPVKMRGVNGDNSGSTGNSRASDVEQYMAVHMPDIAQRKARILAGQSQSRVMTDS
jgi:hypothetical protein